MTIDREVAIETDGGFGQGYPVVISYDREQQKVIIWSDIRKLTFTPVEFLFQIGFASTDLGSALDRLEEKLQALEGVVEDLES